MCWKAAVHESRGSGSLGYADLDVLCKRTYDELTCKEIGRGQWLKRIDELQPKNFKNGLNCIFPPSIEKQLQTRGRESWEIYPDDEASRLHYWITGERLV